MNPFVDPETASVYARGRPEHHPRTIQRVRALLSNVRVERALDVACGTGMFTAALASLADDVVGVDVVPAMIEQAAASVAARFTIARAEDLPFAAARFGLVAVASAVHWFDQDRFFSEARRVLDRAGVVVVTEHFFLGEMEGSDAFRSWMRDAYAVRYPAPPRGRHLSVSDEVPRGFDIVGKDGWLDPIVMDHDDFVDYLLTQSNTIAAVDGGRESRPRVRAWLQDQASSFFNGDSERILRFWGTAVCYRPSRR